MQEREALSRQIDKQNSLQQQTRDLSELLTLAEEAGDHDLLRDALKDLDMLHQTITFLQLEAMLSGEADQNNCFLEIHAGAGGTEAQDWALMLLRMYTRWAEKKGYKVELLEESEGDTAGLKSATLKIARTPKANHPYGWLKRESGVHRLVRISPFDSSARRHTSFASAWIYPEIDDRIQIEILEKDLRIDTYRASGAGGQHVNKTDSAIRITHLPTNIVVQCQNDRSQHRNRAQAMDMLKARLYELELRRREEASQVTNDAKTEIGWGHQIRSYVLQPYQLVKDLRTGVEVGNAPAVLDGEIDPFLWGMLNLSPKGVDERVD
jgi:peptide chain release factor 2